MPEVNPTRYVVIHGHFYQPPRENPWIEAIEVQDAAAPYHDWNERIAAECYGPNSAARIVGASGGVSRIVNNYAKVSFNIGPTLMAWLERAAPNTFEKIIEADKTSAAERGGHGNAMAQPYNHVILPLATRQDRQTQIRWGIADFKRRFGRFPEGMWLAECAVDEDTLLLLADEGIKFTVLAPQQARRFRSPGKQEWQLGIDPRRPYRIELPGGRTIAVFFYDGSVAHDIAFGQALRDREAIVERILSAFGNTSEAGGDDVWLVNVATDGETFGHHRSFGDMTLAATIAWIEQSALELTNYAHFLDLHPPRHSAEIVYPSSWSCAHGVSRWRDDCGCTTGSRPGWNQRWRRPLRDALDDLRERLAAIYERRASSLFHDPWALRNDYVEVILDRSLESIERTIGKHAVRLLDPGEKVVALKLLEMQRHAMLMFTSCGWFFADISGTEAVQVLKYAARAIQLAREIEGANLEPALYAALTKAASNLPDLGDGAMVFDQRVRPSLVNLGRVVAHYAIASLFDSYPQRGRIFCYRYEADDAVRLNRGSTTLALGHVRLSSEITLESTDASFAVLHFGGHDVRCAVGNFADLPAYEDMKSDIMALFERRSVGDVVRAIDRYFSGRGYALSDLFLDERRKIVRTLLDDILARHRPQIFGIFEENRPLLRFLVENDAPVPGPLRAQADYALSARFLELIDQARFDDPGFDRAHADLLNVRDEARALGCSLDLAEAKRLLEERILEEIRSLYESPRKDSARAVLSYLEIAEGLGVSPNLWEAQNLYWSLTVDDSAVGDVDSDLLLRVGVRLGFDERELGRRWFATQTPSGPPGS
ncbi:MAG: DUF3536 domain-containing protein [Pseudomonadota bacterium]